MSPFPSDYTIVGTVLAVAVAILLLSGLALYVAFRVRETLRDERGGGARTAKVAFLVGLLFISGGVFYFFASGFNALGGGTTQTSLTGTSTTQPSTSSASSSTTVSTSGSSSTSTISTSTSTSAGSTSSTTASASQGAVTMQVAYPSSVNVGQGFYVTFSLYDSGSTTLPGASLDVGNLAVTFSIVNATVCNPGCTSVSWSGGVVAIGNLNPGSTVVTLGLKAPSSPAQFSGQATLNYQGEIQPVTVTITIRVSGRP